MNPQAVPIPDTPQYRYDLFVSHAEADTDWVEDWLRPHLRDAGLSVLTPGEFDLGVPRPISIERAVDQSRHTLLILTPAWIDSGWNEFEALLTQTSDIAARQRKLIPLLLQPCQPPRRIATLNYADFQLHDRREVQLNRVIAAARGELKLPDVGPALGRLLPEVANTQAQRNRSRMLDKVEAFWIKGVLEQSLYQVARLDLGFEHAPAQVSHPWETVLHQANQSRQTIPAGKPIVAVFDDLLGELLILGAPGAGKTTMLLELTRDLIARARDNEQHPIPVVFSLSTWAANRQAFKVWLAEELNQRYDVPKKLAQDWVNANTVLPLLDGLDELAAAHRDACVAAINAFRSGAGFVPLAVCSRVADYEALTGKLRLQGAIVIQALTKSQVDDYLKRVGRPLAAVRTALRDDATLWELMDSPLLLSIVALAYKDSSAAKLRALGTPEERRRQLFDDYIAAMFARPGRSTRTSYTQHKTIHSLSWLAGKMVEQQQTALFIERLQPDWLGRWSRFWFAVRVGLLSAVLGGLLFGLLYGLLGALLRVLEGGLLRLLGYGLFAGLLGGLIGGLVGGVSSYPAEIRPVETLSWSWIAAGGGWRSSLFGTLAGGLLFGLLFGLGSEPSFGLLFGLVGGLGGWVLGWLIGEVTEGQMTKRTVVDNPRIRRFVWHILAGGLVGGLAGGLARGLTFGLLSGLLSGLLFGLVGGLVGALLGVLATKEIPTRTVDGKSIRRASWFAFAGGLVGVLVGRLEGGLINWLLFGLGGTLLGWLGSWLGGRARTRQVALLNPALRRFARNALGVALVCGLLFGLGSGLGVGLLFGLGLAMVGGLLSGLVEGDITTRTATNEGIRRSLRSAAVGGLMFGLLFGPGVGLLIGLNFGLGGGLLRGLLVGLVVGLLYGGATVLQHYTLRWLLYRNGSLPLRLVPFLDYCAERIFLRKVGGGYIFVHRLLMEHFASLYTEQPQAEPVEAKQV